MITDETIAAVLVVLAEAGVPSDYQEMLVYGSPHFGVKPGALAKALEAALAGHAAVDGWQMVPDEFTEELRSAATKGKQVLAYENGRYYNAWLEFDGWEGGWLWTDEADCEPNPSHYMPLPAPPKPTAETQEDSDAE